MGNKQATDGGGDSAPPFSPCVSNSLEKLILERALPAPGTVPMPPLAPPPPFDDPKRVEQHIRDRLHQLLLGACEGASEINLVVSAASGVGGKSFCRWIEKEFPGSFVFVDTSLDADEEMRLLSEEALAEFHARAFERHSYALMAYTHKLLHGWRSPGSSIWNPPNKIRVFYRSLADLTLGQLTPSVNMRSLSKHQHHLLKQLAAAAGTFEAVHLKPDRTLHLYLDLPSLASEYTSLIQHRGVDRHGLKLGGALEAYVDHRCAGKRLLDAYYNSPASLRNHKNLVLQIDRNFYQPRYRELVLYKAIETLVRLMESGLWREQKASSGAPHQLPLATDNRLNFCDWYGKDPADAAFEEERRRVEEESEARVRPAPSQNN